MDWRLIIEEELDGSSAMAFDEVAAETVASGGPATVRLYRWVPSTVTLGYGNDADVVDWAFCDSHGIHVTRRPTGGGAIYHDTTGDVAYSIVAPAESFPGDVTESYRQLLQPVLSAFESVGVDVDFAADTSEPIWEPLCYLLGLDPAHDLVGPDGRKVAGNAQYRTREAIVQHGSLTYAVDAKTHLGCFSDPPVTPETFQERVCGAVEFADEGELSRSRFVDVLERTLAEWAAAHPGTWTAEERARAEEIREKKYANDEWVRRRNDLLE
jgi:lipoate-protein ligase A